MASGGLHIDENKARLLHATMGCVTEAAELMDQFKRHLFYGTDLDVVNAVEELGDNLWYIQLACNILKTTMNEVKHANIEKLKKRYPEKFTSDKAVNRNVSAEQRTLFESMRDIDLDTE